MKSRFNNYLGISSLGIKTITIILIFVFVIQTKHFAQAFYCTEIKLPSEIPAINDLYVNKGILYIATSQGLYTYNDKGFTRFFDPENTDAYRINTICPDKAGNLWFGTYIGLLVKFSANKVLFVQDIKPKCKTDNYLITSISIDTVFKNQNSEVLLSTSGGELFGYNTISNSVKKYENPGPGTVFSIIYGYWPLKCVYTADGFFSMNKNMKWKKKSDYFTIYQVIENNGKYWGIGRDKDTKAMLMLYYDENSDNSHFTWKEFDLSQLSDRYSKFNELAFTSGEIAWIVTDNGLIRYNPTNASLSQSEKIKGIDLRGLKHIAVESDDIIWLSSSGKRTIKAEIH